MPFPLERLPEARSVLECGEAGRRLAASCATATGGGEHGGGADEPAEQEGAQAL
jgi:hypothetical protein